MNYSNPRMEAVIENWPYGKYRTTATFKIETHPTRGQRGTRMTIDPKSGKPTALKVLTYAGEARIVDGDDGRTYILEKAASFNMITVMKGDMKHAHETIFEKNERFNELMKLFSESNDAVGDLVPPPLDLLRIR